MFCSRQQKTNILLATSVTVLLLGVLIKWAILPFVIEGQVYANLELIEGTQGYDVWLEPPNEIYIKYYFFNVENPEEIKSGAKPVLKQVGPYIYKEKRLKQNIVPIGDEELQYGQWISYTFDLDQVHKHLLFTDLKSKSHDRLTI